MTCRPEFLQAHAETRCFSLGLPHAFTARPDGSGVLFLRSRACDVPLTSLWLLDLATGEERLVVDAWELAGDSAGDGIASYACDAAVTRACFVVADALWVVDLAPGAAARRLAEGRFADARLDPTGATVAFVADGSLCALDVAGGARRTILASDDDGVTFGLPEYVAGDMGRTRGYWWSPDGSQLVVARVDDRGVARWHVSDPADPASAPAALARPMAGGVNADVGLWLVSDGREPVAVDWDRVALEYLVGCSWSEGGLLVTVQSRDQGTVEIRRVDPATGSTTLLHRESDPSWVTTIRGLPVLLPSGALVRSGTLDDTHALFVGDAPVTPPGLQLVEAYGLCDEELLFAATDDSTETHVWTYSTADGLRRLSEGPGVHSGAGTAATAVVGHEALELERPIFEVHRAGAAVARIATTPQPRALPLRLELLATGAAGVRTALLLPEGHEAGDAPLPVLLDPYGGLGLRKVLKARTAALLVSQWFAEQGFAVVVADGHGTPGRGPAWERSVRGDIETAPIADQVEALHAVAEARPGVLDLDRVAIRGWSWGGFLAAACVLRRPDVFHAAIAGAAVLDQHLYHSYWKERQLGHPAEHPQRYERHSLTRFAHDLERPLLLIHGLADDNVLPAHTLRLSSALMEARRPHDVLLLPGHDHDAIRQPVSRYLLEHQLEFLQRALPSAGSDAGRTAAPTLEETR